ncbi:MAG: hypothetical protein KBH09_15440 [Saprospiraceae bacterium]|jgi:hypothetical protein|nr:hypothetical protein [Saprospiraceae bacterium]
MRRCEPFKATSAHAIRRSDVAPNGATSFCIDDVPPIELSQEWKYFTFKPSLNKKIFFGGMIVNTVLIPVSFQLQS